MPISYADGNINQHELYQANIASYNYSSYLYWYRRLVQKLASIMIIDCSIFKEDDRRRARFWDLLVNFGYLGIWNSKNYGLIYSTCHESKRDIFYIPVEYVATIASPIGQSESRTLKVNEDVSIIRLTPDARGITDIISKYAEELCKLDADLDMYYRRAKSSAMAFAKNKSQSGALKRWQDNIDNGQTFTVLDYSVSCNVADGEPFFIWESSTDVVGSIQQLQQARQTVIDNFLTEIGIPTLPTEKKERMITDEANSKETEANACASVWYDILSKDAEVANKLFPELNLTVELRSKKEAEEQEAKQREQMQFEMSMNKAGDGHE